MELIQWQKELLKECMETGILDISKIPRAYWSWKTTFFKKLKTILEEERFKEKYPNKLK